MQIDVWRWLQRAVAVIILSILILAIVGRIASTKLADSIGIDLAELLHGNNLLIFAGVVFAIVIFWEYIAATLRTLFTKWTSLALFTMAAVIYAAAQQKSELPFIGLHPAAWDYTATFLLITGELVVFAWLLQPSKTISSESRFWADNPETMNGEPTESQRIILNDLGDMLEAGDPRSIALTGDWGVGKSAIIKQLTADISRRRKDIITVYFHPWGYTSEEALVQGFYSKISNELKAIPGLQEGPFGRLTISVEHLINKHDKTGLFAFLMSLAKRAFGDGLSPEHKIRNILEREGRRILIVIDDIERSCNTQILYRSLQLAQHARDIEYVQIVTVFEKDLILNAKPAHVSHPEEYLEKLFEIELRVPNPESDRIREFMQSCDRDPPLLTDYIPSSLLKDIKTHRGAIRLMNGIILKADMWERVSQKYSSIKSFKTFINSSDLLAIVHIELKYPLLFADIDKNRSFYTQPQHDSEEYFAAHLTEEGESRKKEKYIERLFTRMNLTVESRTRVTDLLEDLFPEVASALSGGNHTVDYAKMRAEKRLGLREILDAYFGRTKGGIDKVLKHEEQADKVLTALTDSTSEDVLIEKFKEYISYTRSQPGQWNNVLGVLFSEITDNEQYEVYQIRAARAALLAAANSGTHYGRTDLVLISDVFYLLQGICLRLSTDKEKCELLKSVFGISTLKDQLNNPAVAVYIAKMEMSDAAKHIAGIAKECELKQDLESLAVDFLDKYFKDPQLPKDVRPANFLYVLESWRVLENSVTGDGKRSSAYLKRLVQANQSRLLKIFVTKASSEIGNYELTDTARYSSPLVHEAIEYFEIERLEDPEDKDRFKSLKRRFKEND